MSTTELTNTDALTGEINLEQQVATSGPVASAPMVPSSPNYSNTPLGCDTGTNVVALGADLSHTPTVYQATVEDIAVLRRQIVVDEERAAELLNKYHGNHVMAIMAFHQIRPHADTQVCTDITGKSTMARENTESELQDESQNKYISENVPVCDLLGAESGNSILTECRTHVLIDLTPDTQSFSKRKRFATLGEIVADYRTHLTPPEHQLGLNIYPVQGEMLFRWSMVNAGLLVYATQIRANQSVVADGILRRINKSATLIARSCGHIAEDHCIIDGAVLVNNLAWPRV